MNRDLADERLWQFRDIEFSIPADELISVEPFKPKDINIEQRNKSFVIQGQYGVDIFPNHKFVLLVNGELIEYNKVEELPTNFDNVIKYAPDDTHDITFTYTFKRNGKEFKYTHWVHHDMGIWEKFLPELIKRETNGGHKNASSNQSR